MLFGASSFLEHCALTTMRLCIKIKSRSSKQSYSLLRKHPELKNATRAASSDNSNTPSYLVFFILTFQITIQYFAKLIISAFAVASQQPKRFLKISQTLKMNHFARIWNIICTISVISSLYLTQKIWTKRLTNLQR